MKPVSVDLQNKDSYLHPLNGALAPKKRKVKQAKKAALRKRRLARKLLGKSASKLLRKPTMKCVLCYPEAFPSKLTESKREIVGICIAHMTQKNMMSHLQEDSDDEGLMYKLGACPGCKQ